MPDAIARLNLAPVESIFRNEYRWLPSRPRLKLGCTLTAEDIASETFVQRTVHDSLTQALRACCSASLQ